MGSAAGLDRAVVPEHRTPRSPADGGIDDAAYSLNAAVVCADLRAQSMTIVVMVMIVAVVVVPAVVAAVVAMIIVVVPVAVAAGDDAA